MSLADLSLPTETISNISLHFLTMDLEEVKKINETLLSKAIEKKYSGFDPKVTREYIQKINGFSKQDVVHMVQFFFIRGNNIKSIRARSEGSIQKQIDDLQKKYGLSSSLKKKKQKKEALNSHKPQHKLGRLRAA